MFGLEDAHHPLQAPVVPDFFSPEDSSRAKCNVFLKGLTSVYLFVLPLSSHNTCRQLGFGGLCVTSSSGTEPPGSPAWRCKGCLQRKCGLFQWLSGKESTCIAGNMRSVHGSGRSSGVVNGNPLQYSCLENPVDRGAWQAMVHGVSKTRTGLRDQSTSTAPEKAQHTPCCSHFSVTRLLSKCCFLTKYVQRVMRNAVTFLYSSNGFLPGLGVERPGSSMSELVTEPSAGRQGTGVVTCIH